MHIRVVVRFALVVGALVGAGANRAYGAGPALGPGAIAASVRDGAGAPVAGAIVVADGPTQRRSLTGSAGIATLQALPFGTYAVRITRAGYEPYAKQVSIARGGTVPTILDVRIAAASFANLRDVASALATPALSAGGDPFVAHALGAAPGVDVVPQPSGAGSAPSLAGTSGESRVELDGIPIAGGSSAFAALRFRNALALDDIELVAPPALRATTVRDAVGGIVNYRTPALEGAGSAEFAIGYDSEFGPFQHARLTRTFGKLGILSDAVTGGGENRSQTFKARYALSNSTSLGFASYGSQSAATVEGLGVTSIAPAYAADLRTSLGRGTLTARRFESAARTSSAPLALPALREDARVAGVQIGYELPQGKNVWRAGFDRRAETDLASGATALRATFTALTLGGEVQVSRVARLEAGDAYSGGTLLPPRNDPHVALVFQPAGRLTVRVAAGSAYATPASRTYGIAAGGAFAAGGSAAALAPETSFAYRLGVDAALGSEDHAWFSAFSLRRYDALATLSDGRALGVQIGVERAASASNLGGVASLDLVRSIAFGAPQPILRSLATPAVAAGAELAGVPYSKARLALTYRADASELRVGTTLLGANNALGTHAVALGDASLSVPFLQVLRLRVGIQNAFGALVADPALRPYYTPREFTFVAEPVFDEVIRGSRLKSSR